MERLAEPNFFYLDIDVILFDRGKKAAKNFLGWLSDLSAVERLKVESYHE